MFVANAAFAASMVVFGIPTGVVDDTFGRRVSVLASIVVVAAGTLGCVAADAPGMGVTGFAAVSVLLGLGYCFYSGALEARLVEALTTTGFTDGLDGVFAGGQLVTGAAMLLGTAGGGRLAGADLALPYPGRAVLLAALSVAAWRLMHDVGLLTAASAVVDHGR